MKITRANAISIALTGGGSLFVGVLYALGSIWFNQRSSGKSLGMETDALYKSRELHALFSQLMQLSEGNAKISAAYNRALAAADELVLLDEVLREEKNANIQDASRASSILEVCLKNIESMMTYAKSMRDDARMVKIESLRGKINDVLQSHVASVMRSTDRIRVGV